MGISVDTFVYYTPVCIFVRTFIKFCSSRALRSSDFREDHLAEPLMGAPVVFSENRAISLNGAEAPVGTENQNRSNHSMHKQ